MNIDRGLINADIFLDLTKAFDTVDRNILLMKLQCYGLRSSCHEWFTLYLSNRTQTCLINTSMSTPKLVKCGVPQGTILGPLLFLLYINDLPNCLNYSLPRMYTDDTSLTYASADLKSIDNCINYDLNRVYIWLSANKLTLNLTKTDVLLIALRQKLSTFSETPSFSINDYTVKEVSSAKTLGVLIDQNLNWECHIQSICQKICFCFGCN